MILVTGATGNIGRAVVTALHAAGENVVVLVRNAEKAKTLLPPDVPTRVADYADGPAVGEAMQGIEQLVFIPSDGDATDVLQHHANIITAAHHARVAHTVFISISDLADTSPFYFTPVYRDAEQRIAEADLSCARLRCNLYAEFVRDHYLLPAVETGRFDAPLGTGQIAPVARADVAEATIAAIRSPEHAGRIFELTGPDLLDGHDLAAAISETHETPVVYDSIPLPDYLLNSWATQPPPWPHAFSSMAQSIAQGHYGKSATGIQDLIGRPPTEFKALLARS
ncbi:MAG: NAD(P)H-binding protein [Pseudomonadota bacterium]